jgi:SAM-dependent methyltransferase
LVPTVVALAVGAPHDRRVAWQRYWGETTGTGDTGDVLWDAEDTAELDRYRALAARYLDPTLPLVDLGCGNGRYTRGLADLFPETLGVDIAPAAVELAMRESGSRESGSFPEDFVALDIIAPDSGARLRELVGEANVFVRGVLHILGATQRRHAAETIRAVLGRRGRLLLAETDYRAGTLNYLEHLGASRDSFPEPLRRAVATLPRPHHFGRAELAATFPSDGWEVLAQGPTPIAAVPMHAGSDSPEIIPGYLAVLRARS